MCTIFPLCVVSGEENYFDFGPWFSGVRSLLNHLNQYIHGFRLKSKDSSLPKVSLFPELESRLKDHKIVCTFSYSKLITHFRVAEFVCYYIFCWMNENWVGKIHLFVCWTLLDLLSCFNLCSLWIAFPFFVLKDKDPMDLFN